MQYETHKEKIRESLKHLEPIQQKEALACLKQYEKWVRLLRKQSLNEKTACFLGDAKWQKNFSINDHHYAIFFYFSNTQEGFANFFSIEPIEKPTPDALEILIESYFPE